MKTSAKKDQILDSAQALIQKRGYNGFSYADISNIVDIRKASIHHHFPTKEDLALAVINRYREEFNYYLLNIGNEINWMKKITLYTELYKQVLDEEKLCLCGMLASDVETLPERVKKVIRDFFSENVRWLTEVLKSVNQSLPEERLVSIAWQIINLLQGGVMMARILKEPIVFSSSCEEMMFQLKALSSSC